MKKLSVRISRKQILVGREAVPMLSGEVHYWRLYPENWGTILDTVSQMGIRVVATYVPWEHHEYKEGIFDFAGDSHFSRNLLGFLELLEKKGFWVILKPGPYGWPEWPNFGLPTYVARYHRLHPAFLRAAERYLKCVCKAISPHLATRGGCVVMVQACNEVEPFVFAFEDQMGLCQEPGLFQEFLKEKYGRIARLNRAWGTSHRKFEDAGAVVHDVISDGHYFNRHLDYKRFVFWYNRRYLEWVIERYRDFGIDVPISTNCYAFFGHQNWRELQGICDIQGPDFYPNNEFRNEPADHRKFLEKVRYTRSYATIPYSPEFEAGIAHGLHYMTNVLSARHYRLMSLSALLGGLVGWNWYMLVNRDNWYMSPINEWGRKKSELFKAFQEIVALYKEINPPLLEKVTTAAATFDIMHHSTRSIASDDPTLSALYQAGIDYEFFDVETGKISKDILFYSGASWMSRGGQEMLAKYVRRGGHLILFATLPTMDDNMRPLNLLNLRKPDRITASKSAELVIGARKVHLIGPLFSYNSVPGEKIVARQLPTSGGIVTEFTDPGLEEFDYMNNLLAGQEVVIGYTVREGKGTITVLGAGPTPELIVALHSHFGVPIPVRSEGADISTALFRKDKSYFVIAVNNATCDKTVSINLARQVFKKERYHVKGLSSRQVVGWVRRSDPVFHLDVPSKDGTVVKLD